MTENVENKEEQIVEKNINPSPKNMKDVLDEEDKVAGIACQKCENKNFIVLQDVVIRVTKGEPYVGLKNSGNILCPKCGSIFELFQDGGEQDGEENSGEVGEQEKGDSEK